MLVLTRKVGESVVVNAYDKDGNPVDIIISIPKVDRGKVSIGFTAPKEIPINRYEIYRDIVDGIPKPTPQS